MSLSTKCWCKKQKNMHQISYSIIWCLPKWDQWINRGELLVAESCSVTFLYIPYHIELLLTSGIHVGPPYECQGKGPVPWSFWQQNMCLNAYQGPDRFQYLSSLMVNVRDIRFMCIGLRGPIILYTIYMPNSSSKSLTPHILWGPKLVNHLRHWSWPWTHLCNYQPKKKKVWPLCFNFQVSIS